MKRDTKIGLFVIGGFVGVLAAAGIYAIKSVPAVAPVSATPEAPQSGESAEDLLRAKVRPGPIKANEQNELEAALNDRFPGGSRVTSHTEFYFDAGAMSCGDVRPHGSGRLRRYIYRNGYVMTEGDQSQTDFDMFWQICAAGGRYR